jgi:hypothetical protein
VDIHNFYCSPNINEGGCYWHGGEAICEIGTEFWMGKLKRVDVRDLGEGMKIHVDDSM